MATSRSARKRTGTTKNRKLIIAVSAAAVGVLLLVGGVAVAAQFGAEPEKQQPLAEPEEVLPFQIPTPGETRALSTDAATSDVFDWWIPESADDSVRFLASDDAHEGEYSLAVVSDGTTDVTTAPQVRQSTAVTVGTTYTVSFWAKSLGASEGAVTVLLGPWATVATIPVPGGTYDWALISAEYTAPQATASLNVRFAVTGETSGLLLDTLTVTGPGGAALPYNNGGFEAHSADLSIENTTLLFEEGTATVDVASRRASPNSWYHWTVTAGDSVIESGDAPLDVDSAGLDLSDLTAGYYSLTLQATLGQKVIDRATTFAVVRPLPDSADLVDSPFGIHLHFKGGEERVGNVIESLALAGVGHVRADVSWSSSELAPGQYAYSAELKHAMAEYEKYGMSALQLPVYANILYDKGKTPSTPEGLQAYANYSKNVLDTFPNVGQDIEVYNEFDHTFNNGACGRTPECYLQMLSAVSNTIGAENPDAVIVGPGNAGMGFQLDWLEKYFQLGGLDYTDVVSAHPYLQPEKPESMVKDLLTLKQMVADHSTGDPKPIWISEIGWSTSDGRATDTEQADDLVRTMALALGNGASRVYWYEAADSGLDTADSESNFGLFEGPTSFLPNTFAPKQAAVAQSVLSRELLNRSFASTDDVGPDTYSYRFGTDADAVRVLWSTVGSSVMVAATKAVTVTDMFGLTTELSPTDGVVPIPLGERAVYLSGDVTAVTAAQ